MTVENDLRGNEYNLQSMPSQQQEPGMKNNQQKLRQMAYLKRTMKLETSEATRKVL